MATTCWAYDSSAPADVRKALRREGQAPDDACLLADCGGRHCSPNGEDVCHYSPDGKKKKGAAGGKPRRGLRLRPRARTGRRRGPRRGR